MRSSVVLPALLAVAAACLPPRASAAPDMLVGVLEDAPPASSGAPPRPQVRALFRHTVAGGWEAYPNDCLSPECLVHITAKYPTRTVWSVSLEGLTLGSVVARTPAAFETLPGVGRQDIIGRNAVPFVGRASLEFAGPVNVPVHRPLLATSSARKPRRAAALWKEGIPQPEDLDRVWPVFRRLVPLIDNCEPPAATAPDETATATAGAAAATTAASQPGRHPARLELQIPVAWVARNGDALLRVAIRSEVYRECDGPRRYPSQIWFYREAQGRVRPLPGQLADDRTDLVAPLEFSDLLRDGGEQVLFMAAAHERGGYVLYTDHFRRRIDYLWAYH